jgi:tagaturonate reductase
MKTHSVLPAFTPIATTPLPERVIQFGTGVLLRGLCDALIDKANQQGIFNGRVVAVKSTQGGDFAAFARQQNQYTVCVRGVEDGQTVHENSVATAISRTLNAADQWADVLACAHQPELQIVLSNTTEVGIQYVEESLLGQPPASFPAKLTAFLYERFRHFDGADSAGMVIVPTELIVDNGHVLRETVTRVARYNGLPGTFLDWLNTANTFCNSLVDRIVPGRPTGETLAALETELGYTDELLVVTEAYRLWAIEGSDRVRSVLSFAEADPQVIIRPDITQFRELKLRLLNGAHTLMCGLGYLAGKELVRELLDDEGLGTWSRVLMQSELAVSVPGRIEGKTKQRFAYQVLDRFRNPYIDHKLLNITVQYTAKMKARNLPLLLNYYREFGNIPPRFALGFAAYLLFMKAIRVERGVYYGERFGQTYPIQCDSASYFFTVWQSDLIADVVAQALSNTNLWGYDLTMLPSFQQAVTYRLKQLMQAGVRECLGEAQLA